MIFLQVTQPLLDAFMTRLGDQLFSIVLLVIFAVYMLKKQKALEDKLDEYMRQDREEMKEAIQRNTQAFDNLSMRFSAKIITAFLLAVTFSSCGVTKKSRTESSSTDTAIGLTRYSAGEMVTGVFRYSKDTSFLISAKHVSGILDSAALIAAYTKDGTRVNRHYQTTVGGLTAYVQTLPNGSIEYGCAADSFTVVINRLIQDSIFKSKSFDSLQLRYRLNHTENKTAEVKESGGFSLLRYLALTACLVVIILAVLFFLHYKKLIK